MKLWCRMWLCGAALCFVLARNIMVFRVYGLLAVVAAAASASLHAVFLLPLLCADIQGGGGVGSSGVRYGALGKDAQCVRAYVFVGDQLCEGDTRVCLPLLR